MAERAARNEAIVSRLDGPMGARVGMILLEAMRPRGIVFPPPTVRASPLTLRAQPFPSPPPPVPADAPLPEIDARLFEAAKQGDAATLGALLDAHPAGLAVRAAPYDWTLLHTAAQAGRLAAVELILARGFDVNARDRGDNSYAMHWAAAAGHVDVVRRLIEAGGDVIGHGDDHDLDVIGWATCWWRSDDDAHREIADLLIAHGAHHHIFSAIAMNRGDEVRRIVAADPTTLHRRMSHSDEHRTPLHHAIAMRRPEMVALLIELGADPLAVDGAGLPAPAHALTPDVDRPVMERLLDMTAAELISAERCRRAPRIGTMDLVATLALGDYALAERLIADGGVRFERGAAGNGVLHMMAKRGDLAAVRWLLGHGAGVNALWTYGDADVTPLHLTIMGAHADVVRALLDAGADPAIRDSRYDGDALGWARHFGRDAIATMLDGRAAAD